MNGDFMNLQFWTGRNVFITGHTGFKGSWLCLWLSLLGAKVTGYALQPPTNPSLFEQARIEDLIDSVIGDIREIDILKAVMQKVQPEIIIHMAAQPLVRESYKSPVETYQTNVMGTVNILEAVRSCNSVKAVVNVTTDKCYENKEWVWGYRENEPLGGFDPYSSSKACSELVTAAYRNSYFHPAQYADHGVAVATARAGNVIGGGDWAADRLVPDIIRALIDHRPISVRHPQAIRPWQHVLEPLSGYLLLAQRLVEAGSDYGESWNFGPDDADAKPVEWIVKKLCERWGKDAGYIIAEGIHPHETHYLKLDCSKAKERLGWQPKWDLKFTLDKVVDWVQAWQAGDDLRTVCLQQITDYMKSK
jgi:CDP-glucose 4,6-dehydratase